MDMAALKNVPVQSIFCAWVEDWEEGARKKKDCVTEACAKYKGLIFCNPDTDLAFKVWEQNLEFRRGRGDGGWYVIGECADDPNNIQTEAFTLEIASQLIGDTKQKE